MNPTRQYLLWLLAGTIVPLGLIAGFNVLHDPSWAVSFPNGLNRRQVGFDERSQKAGYLYYRVSPGTYENLLLGSSRATFIPQEATPGGPTFNFGVSALNPDEGADIIRFFQETQGEPKRIYLVMDFYGTKADPPRRVAHVQEALEAVQEPFYRAKIMLSGDTLDDSKDVWRLRADASYRERRREYYEGPDHKRLRRVDEEEHRQIAEKQRAVFLKRYFAEDYLYRDDYAGLLEEIALQAGSAEMIVLTAPISADLFDAVVGEGRIDDYARWLREMVQQFGRVFDSMGYTHLTTAEGAYYDSDHFYPEHARDWLGAALNGNEEGFGLWVDASNVERHIENQRAAYRSRVQQR